MESFTETKPRRDQNPKPKNKKRGGQGGQHYEKKRPQEENGEDVPMAEPNEKKPKYQPRQEHPETHEEEKKAPQQSQQRQTRQFKSHRSTNEPGFTGPSETWFDDIEFKKQLTQDLQYNEQKHDYYFGSYSHFYIHEEMLKDQVRTNAYRDAIEGNPEAFKDKIVLDIGAGTGILSIFAARAGAKHVYAIENAEIAFFAREIIKNNGLSDKITVIKGKMEEITLPVDKVDIIISEWMGYFLLYESMLDSVLWARDKYLAPDGKMFPDRAIIYMAAMEDEGEKRRRGAFWKNQYGVDMSIMTNVVLKEPCIDYLNAFEDRSQFDMIISSTEQIIDFDLVHMKKEDVNFSASYSLLIKQNSTASALVTWFDCLFHDVKKKVRLSTSPFEPYTHWKNTIFYIDKAY